MNKENILLIKQLIHGYSIMQEKPKDTTQEWYNQTQEIKKYFGKRKAEPVTKKQALYLTKKIKEIKQLDIEYFENKEFSPYMVVVMLIDYLIREEQDIEMRSKFLHYNTKEILEELEKEFKNKDVLFDHFKYIQKILRKLTF